MSQSLKCSFDKAFLERARLLYIENEEVSRKEATEIFAVFFKKVLIARDKEEGINVFLENRSEIDIILLDINLPNSTGIELLEEIRKVDWDIPILIVAAFTEVESLASWPQIAFITCAQSVTSRVIGPIWSKDEANATKPKRETRP